MFEDGAKLTRVEGPLSTTIGDEEVLLDPDTGTYYGMNEVGARVWSVLDEPRTTAELVDTVAGAYDVERPQVEQDVLAFLDDLREAGLVAVADAE